LRGELSLEDNEDNKDNKAEVFILLWKFQDSLPPIFAPINSSSLISLKNTDVELFHDCNHV